MFSFCKASKWVKGCIDKAVNRVLRHSGNQTEDVTGVKILQRRSKHFTLIQFTKTQHRRHFCKKEPHMDVNNQPIRRLVCICCRKLCVLIYSSGVWSVLYPRLVPGTAASQIKAAVCFFSSGGNGFSSSRMNQSEMILRNISIILLSSRKETVEFIPKIPSGSRFILFVWSVELLCCLKPRRCSESSWNGTEGWF